MWCDCGACACVLVASVVLAEETVRRQRCVVGVDGGKM